MCIRDRRERERERERLHDFRYLRLTLGVKGENTGCGIMGAGGGAIAGEEKAKCLGAVCR